MDAVAIAELWKQGGIVTMLLIAVMYFVVRDRRQEKRAEKRHRDCEDRNEELGGRIKALEDRQFERLENLAERSIAGLAASTAAIRRSLGDHITPPEPLPSLTHPSHR